MRKFGNQPLYPTDNSIGGAGKFKNTPLLASSIIVEPDRDGSETNGQNLQPQKKGTVSRRMKAFSTPKPLATALVPDAAAAFSTTGSRGGDGDGDEDDDEGALSAYAAFLVNANAGGHQSTTKKPSIDSTGVSSNSKIGSRSSRPESGYKIPTAAAPAQTPAPTTSSNSIGTNRAKRFNAPLLLPTSFPTETDGNQNVADLLINQQQKQRASYLKKQRQPPLLLTTTNYDSSISSQGRQGFVNNIDEGEIITKSFQPLSRKTAPAAAANVNTQSQSQRQNSTTQEFIETSATSTATAEGNAFDLENEDTNKDYRGYIRHSDGFGNEVVIEKAKAITFDFAGSAKGSRTKLETLTANQEESKLSKADRGKKLQGMLRLDPCSVELFRLNELDYEKYMGAVRIRNCLQVHTQTFDDGMEEGTQTDLVNVRMKWTQIPSTGWSKNNAMNIQTKSVQAEAIGVGDDTIDTTTVIDNKTQDVDEIDDVDSKEVHKNHEKLNRFLFKSCRLMLAVLSSQKTIRLVTGKIGSDTKNLVKLNKSFNFLDNLKPHSLYCNGDLIASCNGPELIDSNNSCSLPFTIVTVWTWREPSVPIHFLRVFSHVTTLEINSVLGLIVVGCKDASVNCFNLQEHVQYHKQEENQTIRSPSVNTSCWAEPNHESQITGLALVLESKNCAQIISLDQDQLLICWSLFLHTKTEEASIAESVWSKLKLKIRSKINIRDVFAKPTLKLLSLRAWQIDKSAYVNLAITTNGGFLGKTLLRGGTIFAPPSSQRQNGSNELFEKYLGGITASAIVVVTSFDIQLEHKLILASYEDGFCRLFVFGRSEPILLMNCYDTPFKIRWSKRRSSMFYIGYQDRLEFWDILQSDVVPESQSDFKETGKELLDFEVFSTNAGEFVAILTTEGSFIGSPPHKVEPLSPKGESRFQMYVQIIASDVL